jgi:class 3 adenylate cyclase
MRIALDKFQQYASQEEKKYCRNWIEIRKNQLNRFGYYAHFYGNIVFFLLTAAMFPAHLVKFSSMVQLSFMPTLLFGYLHLDNQSLTRKTMIFFYFQCLFELIFSWYYVVDVLNFSDLSHSILSLIGLIAVFSTVGYQGSISGVFTICCLTLVTLSIVIGPRDSNNAYLAAMFFLFSLGIFVRLTLYYLMDQAARSEYRYRSMIAPDHIVQQSLQESKGLDEIFGPTLKSCICLSSDWRRYQKLSAHLSPQHLNEALNQYYKVTYDLLQRHLPHDTYFADWIADELVVVLYAADNAQLKPLVDRIVRFSVELLAAKKYFRAEFGFPEGIDIGIASGAALVGLMGPKNHRKATAIGSIPVRARQLQTMGKILRGSLGPQDRVIFGQEVYEIMSSHENVTSFPLGKIVTHSVLKDSVVYFQDAG